MQQINKSYRDKTVLAIARSKSRSALVALELGWLAIIYLN